MQPIRTNNQASTFDDKGPTRDVKSPKMGRSSSVAHYQNLSDAFCITLGMAHKSDGAFLKPRGRESSCILLVDPRRLVAGMDKQKAVRLPFRGYNSRLS